MFASVIQIYEKINDGQLKRLFKDIKRIKDGTYIDECAFVDMDEDMKTSGSKNKLSDAAINIVDNQTSNIDNSSIIHKQPTFEQLNSNDNAGEMSINEPFENTIISSNEYSV